MSECDDIFADNSSEGTDYMSSSSRQDPQESILIEETDTEVDDEEDEEEKAIRERIKKRQSRRMSFHPRQTSSDVSSDENEDNEEGEVTIASDGDTSEEERLNESRALSPATRLSLSGIRPPDLNEDDDDGDDDDDEVVVGRKNKRNVLISDDEDEVVQEKGDSFDDSLPLRSFNAEGSSASPKLSSTGYSHDGHEESVSKGRLSRDVRMSIETKLSSTALEPRTEEGANRSDSDPSSLVIMEKSSEEVLSLSSDDEKPVKIKPLVQPTIKAALAKQRVSQKFYDSKVRELADLQKKHEKMGNLSKLNINLPDKGVGLQKAKQNLEKEIANMKGELASMEVHDSRGIRDEIQKSFESSVDASGRIVLDSANSSVASNNGSMQSAGNDRKSNNNNNQVVNISWDDIQKEVDKIQPKHTGKQGIATFETQKTITIDRLATLHKSIEGCPSEDTLADPPKLLRIELMDHQRHALAWMLWRESLKPRGGILADDMGLGKTLSMISLILKKAELEDPDQEEEESSDDEEQEDNGWTAKGRRDYFAGGTLIICPASLMRQWEGEIKNRVARNSLAVNVYHGTNRDVKPRHLAKYDVLITTYNIASREAKSERSGIFGVNWERIILDEAHMIRNHKSAMSEACCRLRGRFRWVLTGTPIQNKEMDMYALLKFLRCTPFDDLNHWKKWIDNKTAGGMARLQTIMKSLMLRRTKKQLQEKGSLQCLPEKNVELVEVTLEKDEMNVYQKVLLYSRTLIGQFLHQRAEKDHDGFMGTQRRNIPTFEQNRLPNMAFDRVHQKLKQMHANDEVKQFQILVLLLRLRQICCHPGLIHQMLEDDDGNFDLSTVEDENAQELDLLAQLNKLKLTDNPSDAVESEARVELDISGNSSQDAAAITKASSKVMLRSNPVFDLTRMSSKIARLLQLLDEKILNSDDKAVIVSQWSSVLDIVAHHLSSKRVRYVSLTGKVPVKFRNDIVTDFNKQGSGPKVMLLSLTAGGVGLNLVGANHLLLLDLHWNPQLEAQAQDRVYRVGQKKTVFVWKFMCVETVEQAIRGLQEKKIGIANEVLTGTKQKGSKLSIDDLKALFGM
ncbi:hypothetical protein RP20_CCG014912 [Aedes albopictus]|nr:hypothetical protein RP20_CCG014912 [Aedes albopictus]